MCKHVEFMEVYLFICLFFIFGFLLGISLFFHLTQYRFKCDACSYWKPVAILVFVFLQKSCLRMSFQDETL